MRIGEKQLFFQSPASQRPTLLPKVYPLLVMTAYVLSVLLQGVGYLSFLLLALAVWLGGNRKGGIDYVSSNLLMMLVFFIAMGPLSKHFNLVLHLEESLKIAAWVALSFVFSRISIISLTSFLSFARLFTLLGFALLPTQLDRFQGFYSHPNHLAYVCSLLIAWTVLLDSRGRKSKWIYVSLLFLAVLASKSSGGLINALVALSAGLAFGRKVKFANLVLAFLAVAIGGGGAIALGLGDELLDKVVRAFDADLVERADAQAFGADGSFVWRVTYWIAIYSDFSLEGDQAYLFGIGPGLMGAGSYFYDYMIVDPHNDFLRTLVERGWIGLAFMVYIFKRFAGMGGLSMIFILLLFLQMLVGNVVVHLPTMAIFIGLLSLVLKIKNIDVCGGKLIA